MKVKNKFFKVFENEIPKGKIIGITIPDLTKEERFIQYCGDKLLITIELEGNKKHMVLCNPCYEIYETTKEVTK